MEYFIIYAEDAADTLTQRMETRPRHLERLHLLHQESRLLIAGPCPADHDQDVSVKGFTGSVIIAQFSSLGDALAWAENDPYVHSGVYKQVTVKPYKPVLGSGI